MNNALHRFLQRHPTYKIVRAPNCDVTMEIIQELGERFYDYIVMGADIIYIYDSKEVIKSE